MENARTTQHQAFDPEGTRQDSLGEAMYALLSVIFAPAIAALIEKLLEIFAAWRAGTLPPLPPLPERAPRASAKSTRRPTGRRHARPRKPVLRPAPTRAPRPRAARPWTPPHTLHPYANPPPKRLERPPKPQKSRFCFLETHAYFVTIN